MIDFHAHAFPDAGRLLTEAAGRLPFFAPPLVGRLGGVLERASRKVSKGLVALDQRLGAHVRLTPDIASVAARGEALPEKWERALEQASGVGLAGTMLLGGTVDALLASMDAHGIEKTVLIGAPPLASNAWLLRDACAAAPERLIPVATLPDLPESSKEEAWLSAYERLANEGARGFKIHSNMDGLDADHPAYRALFQVASKRGQFVILHTGCFHVLGFKRPGPVDIAAFEPLFLAHKDVPVVLAHMNRKEPALAWEVMARHPQLFADTSWQPEAAVRQALGAVGAERLLLGSDWPLLHLGLQKDARDTLRRAASDKELEQVTRLTPKKLLVRAA